MTEEKREKKDFKEYNLKFELLRGLYITGYEERTNIQKKYYKNYLIIFIQEKLL